MRKLLLIVLALGIVVMGSGLAYALTVHELPGLGWSKYDRNFGSWIVTNKTDFQAGVLNNVDINSSPGDVKIGASSSWLAGYSYRKSITIAHSDGVYANTGGTITINGAYTVHTFTSGGTFTAGKSGIVEVLVVGGGGGAGRGGTNTARNAGGGGAGGLVYQPTQAVTGGTGYTVTVGAGGAGSASWAARGVNGVDSIFSTLTAKGGGGGGSRDVLSGLNGGSGGGAAKYDTTYAAGGTGIQTSQSGDSGIYGFGTNGATSTISGAGGGGGAGGAGTVTIGGAGRSFWGVTYAKGGNAQSDNANGAANTGNGGNAAAANSANTGGSGGSGIVIVRCLTTNFLSDNSQTNYQMQVTVSNSSGVSSGSTVYLNGASLNWPYDIRFTTSTGTTLLDYWIESNTSTTATVWVEFDSIPAHPNDGSFYIYYGSADAADVSNGANAFLFFDNFSGDLSKWTKEVNGGNISIVSGYLECGGGTNASSPYGHAVLGSSASYNSFVDGIIEGDVYLTTGSIAEVGYRGNYAANTGYKSRMDARPPSDTGLTHLVRPYVIGSWVNISTGGGPTGISIGTGTWYPFSIRVNGSTLNISCNGQTLVGTNTSYTAAGEISLQNHYGTYSRFDNIRVRKYAYPEPTWGAWGVGETPSYSTSNGTIASDVRDTTHVGARWDLLGNSSSQPANTNITFEVRVSDTLFSNTSSTPAWQIASNYPNLYGQYQQWRATLSTTNGSVTPVLSEVRSLYSW